MDDVIWSGIKIETTVKIPIIIAINNKLFNISFRGSGYLMMTGLSEMVNHQ